MTFRDSDVVKCAMNYKIKRDLFICGSFDAVILYVFVYHLGQRYVDASLTVTIPKLGT